MRLKKEKDFNQYILPQEEYSDLSIKTIAADDNEVNYKIVLSEDYFSDIDDIGKNQMGVKIKISKLTKMYLSKLVFSKKNQKVFLSLLQKASKI